MTLHLTDEQLSASLDGALQPPEVTEIEAHVARCETCRGRLGLLRATAQAVATLPDEPPPAPLDFAFLEAGRVQGSVIVVPRARWRPPLWAVPAAAAAALLVAAVGLGPSLLSRHSAASTSAGLSAGLPAGGGEAPGAPFATSSSVPAQGGAARDGTGAAPALKAQQSSLAPGASETLAGTGGLVLTLTPASTSGRTGRPMGLSLEARAGQAVALTGLSLEVRGRGEALTLARSSGANLGAGQRAQLATTWSAGQLSGAAQPGDYQVEGHATLTDGRDLLVRVTIRVS